jgi:hypothetical protein
MGIFTRQFRALNYKNFKHRTRHPYQFFFEICFPIAVTYLFVFLRGRYDNKAAKDKADAERFGTELETSKAPQIHTDQDSDDIFTFDYFEEKMSADSLATEGNTNFKCSVFEDTTWKWIPTGDIPFVSCNADDSSNGVSNCESDGDLALETCLWHAIALAPLDENDAESIAAMAAFKEYLTGKKNHA